MKVGFIGLGSMGRAMAESLRSAGHALVVYNRTRERADGLHERGVRIAESPAAAARDADVVVTMVADDAAAEAVTLGDHGVIAGLSPGAVHVSSSTISIALSQRFAALHAEAGQGYVAAPVFGRPDDAAAKELWVVAGGPQAALDRCTPVLEALGRGVTRVGESAVAANVVKLVGNFLTASTLEAMGEAIALTRKADVDFRAFVDVLIQVFARPSALGRYAALIASGAYEPAAFKARLALKDLRLALAAGDAMQVPMPLASLVHDSLLTAAAQGRGDFDWSVIAQLAAERAGLAPR
jgi:3-hydroxyisobutyrate dehydrogenase-like beta-hydroxyacid dehydrogenase